MKVLFSLGQINNEDYTDDDICKIQNGQIGENWVCYDIDIIPRKGEFVTLDSNTLENIVESMKISENVNNHLEEFKVDYGIKTMNDMQDVGPVEEVNFYPHYNMAVVVLMPLEIYRKNIKRLEP